MRRIARRPRTVKRRSEGKREESCGGTTHGARAIHLRVASPPIRHPCYFGIDFPDQNELIAHNRSVEEVRKFLGVDSLHYLSMEGMLSCVKMPKNKYCTACFSGRYPIDVHEPVEKFALERGQLKMFT